MDCDEENDIVLHMRDNPWKGADLCLVHARLFAEELAEDLGFDLDEVRAEAEAERATWSATVCPWGWCTVWLWPSDPTRCYVEGLPLVRSCTCPVCVGARVRLGLDNWRDRVGDRAGAVPVRPLSGLAREAG